MARTKLLWIRNIYPQAAVVPDAFCQMVKKAPNGRLFYSVCLTWLALAAMGTSWLVPSHYLPWIVFENESLAFVATALAASALFVRVGLSVRYNQYLYLSLIVFVAILVQYGVGMLSTQVTALGGLYVAAFASAAVVGQQYKNLHRNCVPKFDSGFLLIFLVGILISACVVLAQWAEVEKNFPMLMAEVGAFRPFGNLGQPNNQATLLVSGMVIVDMLWRRSALTIGTAIFCMVLLVIAAAMTGSRTAVVGGAIAAIFLLFHSEKAQTRIFTIGWALAFPVLYTGTPWLRKILFCATESEGVRAFEKLSDSPRMAIYTQLIKAISDNLWIGYGWMQTGFAQSQSALKNHAGFETIYSHNLFLDQVIWFGLPLALMLVLMTAYAVINNYRNGAVDEKMGYALLAPFGVHCMLEFPFAYAYFLLPAGFVLGYLHANLPPIKNTWLPVELLSKTLFATFVGIFIILGALIARDYLMLAEDFRILRFSSKNIGKIPDVFQITDPILLEDMRNSFDVFGYTPDAQVSSVMMAKIQYAALHEHWPSANVKLISLYILANNQTDAVTEFRRFRNLYGTEIVKWGTDGLFSAHCAIEPQPKRNEAICRLLQSEIGRGLR